VRSNKQKIIFCKLPKGIMKKFDLILIVLIALTLLSNAILIPFNQGLWWDEAVYLGLGQNLLKGVYSLDPSCPLETFRPPLFPLFLSLFSNSILTSRILVWFASIFSLIAVFFLVKKIFGLHTGLWATFFMATSYLFIFFSTKVLSEPLFTILLSISVLFFVKWQKERKDINIFLSGLLVGLAFLTRYLGTLLILAFLLYLIWLKFRRKVRFMEIFIFLLGLFIILIPWFWLGIFYYGNPIGPFIENMAITFAVQNMSIFDTFFELLEIWAVMIPFIVIGFYFLIKNRVFDLISIIFLVSLIAWFAFPYKEPRYLLSFFPIFAAIAGFGVSKICKMKAKNVIVFVVLLVSMVVAFFALEAVYSDRFAANGLIRASLELKNITGSNEKIMTESYPWIYYLSERKTVPFPENSSEVLPLIERENVKYILVYKFEPGNPEWVNSYFSSEQFEKIKTFEQWGDSEAVIIYRPK
jgi:4-amino-4-deoxy-L-arabinose transferase-like glycosyltransferase